jgi:hypothetical protein
MVNGTTSLRVAAFPTVTTRIKSRNVGTTAAFSMSSKAKVTTAASLPRAPGGTAASTVAPKADSQIATAASVTRQLFGGQAADTAPFVPAFRNATITDGTSNWGLNHDYFATKDTAQWIANKYGTGQVIETSFEGSGGPFAASANEYQIKLADGRTVNAGILAGYYERNPETQFPGLADKLIRGQLGLG